MPDPTQKTVNLVNDSGHAIVVPLADAASLMENGYRVETSGDEAARVSRDVKEDTYGGVGGKVVTFGANLASGATLGLSDMGIAALGGGEDLKALREVNPLTAGAGQVIGGLAPALVPGGLLARTPAGYLARTANQAIDVAQSARGSRAALGTVAISGAEGAAQNAGSYLSDVALGDRELTAEGMAGALGRGFAFGGVAGGAVYGIQQGTMAARRMFSRTAEGGRTAANDAAAAFERQSDELLTAHDDAYKIAKSRYEEIQAAKAQAMEMRGRANAELAQTKLDEFRTPEAGAVSGPAGSQTPPPAAGTLPAPGARPAVPDATLPQPFKVGDTEFTPTAATAAAGEAVDGTTRLERQLAEMQGQVNAGASLQDMNAARAAQPPVTNTEALLGPQIAEEEAKLANALGTYEQRRARVNEWVSRLKNPRKSLEADPGGGAAAARGQTPAVRGRRTEALAEDVFVEQSGGQLRTIGKMENTLDDITPNSRILARSNADDFSRGSQLDEMYDDAIERASVSEGRDQMDAALHEAADIERQIHQYVRSVKPENAAVIEKIDALRESAGTTGYHAAFKRAESRANRASGAVEPKLGRVDPEQEAFYQESLRSGGPRGPVDTSWMRGAERDGLRMRGEMMQAERAKKGLAPLSDLELAATVGQRDIKPPSMLDEVDEASKVLGDYEKAAADLTEAVGDAAPPKARESSDAFRKAESEVDRKHTDRAARAIDDHANDVAYGPTRRTPKERAADAQAAKLEADATIARLKVEEVEARKAVRELKPARPMKGKKATAEPATAEPANSNEGTAGRFADMGAVLEAANTVGIPGLPKPSDIPLVGPLLGMYLKFRALKAVAGRMTGRVPATGDARAAALAAKTKERVTQSVDRMLGLVERKARTARSVTVVGGGRVAEILAKRIFDDGEEGAGENASVSKLCAVRIRELGSAVADPQAVIAQVRRELADVTDPDLIAAAEKHELRKIQHLNDVAPKGPASNPYVRRVWLPDTAQAARFARRLEVADDPGVALAQVESGTVSNEAAETLRAVYPKLFSMLQQRLLERAPDMKQAIPMPQRLRMSLLFDVALDPLLEPETMATLQGTATAAVQTVSPTQNAAPVPSTAAPVDLTAIYQTPADRRAARR